MQQGSLVRFEPRTLRFIVNILPISHGGALTFSIFNHRKHVGCRILWWQSFTLCQPDHPPKPPPCDSVQDKNYTLAMNMIRVKCI